jgi:hypothetical protein
MCREALAEAPSRFPRMTPAPAPPRRNLRLNPMSSRVRVGIAGTGSYLPERVVPNAYFEKIVDTSDEWIVQRTGIKERRWAAEGQATSDMAVEAGKRAPRVRKARARGPRPDRRGNGLAGPDGPGLLVADPGEARARRTRPRSTATRPARGSSPRSRSPRPTSRRGGRAASSRSGAETLSRISDMKDRTSCILFGDGAVPWVLAPLRGVPAGRDPEDAPGRGRHRVRPHLHARGRIAEARDGGDGRRARALPAASTGARSSASP